jgi:hypothetical protein
MLRREIWKWEIMIPFLFVVITDYGCHVRVTHETLSKHIDAVVHVPARLFSRFLRIEKLGVEIWPGEFSQVVLSNRLIFV